MLSPEDVKGWAPAEVLAAYDRMEFRMYDHGRADPRFVAAQGEALAQYHAIREYQIERYVKLREASLDVYVRNKHLEKADWNAHWVAMRPAWHVYLEIVNEAAEVYRQAMAEAYVEFCSLPETPA